MANLYYLKTDDFRIIDKELDKLKEEYSDYVLYDLDYKEHSISEVLINLDTYNLLEENKLIIYRNLKLKDLMESSDFNKYVLNPNKNHILVLLLDKDNKFIKDNFKNLDNKISVYEEIDKALGKSTMDYDTKKFLIEFSGEKLESIKAFIKDIKTYKNKDSKITKEDILKVSKKDLNYNIFDLLDEISAKNKKNALKILKDLVENKDLNKIFIAYQMADYFRIMLKSMILLNTYSDEEIVKILKVHEYRYKKIISNRNKYKIKDVVNILNKLADLEINFKSGNEKAFELENIIIGM